jgi:hypothetical protein
MNQKSETEIIAQIQKDIEMYGNCSIKQAAERVFYFNMSLADQKKIAKEVVKQYPLRTEIKKGELIVQRNELYTGSFTDTNEDYKTIKSVITVLAALLAYLLLHVFLPKLSY